MMRKKTFDSVEMKRQAQQAVLRKLEGMTPEEEIEFWKQRTAAMREWQAQLRADRGVNGEKTGAPVGTREMPA
jgi:hypothetical protein